MEEHVEFNYTSMQKISEADMHKFINYVTDESKRIFIKYVQEVYLINSQIRTGGNYIPLEEMISAINVQFQRHPLSFVIGIDEDKLTFQDARRRPIYQVGENKSERHKVENLQEYWRTPIDGQQEEDWILTKTFTEVRDFIQHEGMSYLEHITRRK